MSKITTKKKQQIAEAIKGVGIIDLLECHLNNVLSDEVFKDINVQSAKGIEIKTENRNIILTKDWGNHVQLGTLNNGGTSYDSLEDVISFSHFVNNPPESDAVDETEDEGDFEF